MKYVNNYKIPKKLNVTKNDTGVDRLFMKSNIYTIL